MRVRLIIAGILLVVLFVISSGRVWTPGCACGESGPPEVSADAVTAYWGGSADRAVAAAPDPAVLLIERSPQYQYEEERTLEAVAQALTDATESDWDYDSPAEIQVLLRLEDGRLLTLWLSPTEDEDPAHVVGRVTDPDGDHRDFRARSEDLVPAVLGLVALVDTLEELASDPTAPGG
jgi:hypothetical protein